MTGGTGGIGGQIGKVFVDAGHELAITSRRGGAEPAVRAHSVGLDLEDQGSVERGMAEALESLGGLDTLVANAVRWPAGRADRFEEMPTEEWRAVLRANVEGTFALCRVALPALRRSGRGRLVLISSGAAEEGHPPAAHYVAAKAALHGFARAIAWDAGADGVLTNVIAVGFTRTDRNADRFPDELFERAAELTPQRRISSVEDVARIALWLGTGANTSITGEVIREGTSAARTPMVALG